MLGSLAKWLRIIGFDTLYSRTMDDREIARIGRQERRILLTRDRALARKKTLHSAILVGSQETLGQLREVLRAVLGGQERQGGAGQSASGGEFSLPVQPRCPRCNGQLLKAAKESLLNDVPEHVLLAYDSFLRCAECGKVFWDGSHKRMIDEKLREIMREMGVPWKNSGNG